MKDWSLRASRDVMQYLESGGKSGAAAGAPKKKGTANNDNNPWRLKPSAEIAQHLDEVSTIARMNLKTEDYIGAFKKWDDSRYGKWGFISEEEAYAKVGEFGPLPSTVKDVNDFLSAVEEPMAGLFASYCLNELCPETEIELEICPNYKRFDFLGAYNKGKNWKIRGNGGDKAGYGMSGGTLEIDRYAGEKVGEWQSGGELVVNGWVGKYAGYLMKDGGKLVVNGDAGAFVAKWMNGGSVTIAGNTDGWVGTDMEGGTVRVFGNAGEYVGAGMKGGKIVVDGDVTHDIGASMSGGELHLNGNYGSLSSGIRGGSIYQKGRQLYQYGKRCKNG